MDGAFGRADRIAIMQDGVIIQVATPEQLVLSPASEYVAEFTRHIPRAKVLSARTLMRAGPVDGATAGEVAASDRIEDIAARVVASDLPFGVVDGAAGVIGPSGRQAVIEALACIPHRPGARSHWVLWLAHSVSDDVMARKMISKWFFNCHASARWTALTATLNPPALFSTLRPFSFMTLTCSPHVSMRVMS